MANNRSIPVANLLAMDDHSAVYVLLLLVGPFVKLVALLGVVGVSDLLVELSIGAILDTNWYTTRRIPQLAFALIVPNPLCPQEAPHEFLMR